MEPQFNKRAASDMLDTIKGFIQEHPATVAGVLGAGGLGAIGGAMNAGPGEEGETAKDRVLRRVRNALIGGALGAGSAAAIGTGLNYLSGSATSQEKKEGPSSSGPIVPSSVPKDKPKGEDNGGSALPGMLTGAAVGAPAGGFAYKGVTKLIGDPEKAALDALTGPTGPFSKISPKGRSVKAGISEIETAVQDLTSGRVTPRVEAIFGNRQSTQSAAEYTKDVIQKHFAGAELENLNKIISTGALQDKLKQYGAKDMSVLSWRDPALKLKNFKPGSMFPNWSTVGPLPKGTSRFAFTSPVSMSGRAAKLRFGNIARHARTGGLKGAILAGLLAGATTLPAAIDSINKD